MRDSERDAGDEMMNSEEAPDSSTTASHRERRKWRAIFVIGIVLCSGPAIGLLFTVVGMFCSFGQIETAKAPTPGDLASGVHFGQAAMLVGFAAAMVGAPLAWWSYSKWQRLRDGPSTGPWN